MIARGDPCLDYDFAIMRYGFTRILYEIQEEPGQQAFVSSDRWNAGVKP